MPQDVRDESETDAQLADWLRFASLELRPRMGRRLIEQFGAPSAAMQASRTDLMAVEGMTEDLAARIGGPSASASAMDRWMAYARRMQLKVVPFTSSFYPPLLQQIHDPPAALFVRGNPDALTRDAVAIVGTRAATAYGSQAAERFAFALASAGLVVVSGGAIGVDTYAHRGAVSAGRTVVVLGCGLDIPYPAANQKLFARVAGSGGTGSGGAGSGGTGLGGAATGVSGAGDTGPAGAASGAVISEFALGARPDTWRFPARNRIISGMCRATLVVEAAEKSGALITAEFAMEEGREVLAIPGPINSLQSRGCHALIRDGATLVEDADQVLEALGWQQGSLNLMEGSRSSRANLPDSADESGVPTGMRRRGQARESRVGNPTPPPVDLPMDQGAILLALASGQQHLDDLTAAAGLTASQTGAAVTLLEMRGLVRRVPGNLFVRV